MYIFIYYIGRSWLLGLAAILAIAGSAAVADAQTATNRGRRAETGPCREQADWRFEIICAGPLHSTPVKGRAYVFLVSRWTVQV